MTRLMARAWDIQATEEQKRESSLRWLQDVEILGTPIRSIFSSILVLGPSAPSGHSGRTARHVASRRVRTSGTKLGGVR